MKTFKERNPFGTRRAAMLSGSAWLPTTRAVGYSLIVLWLALCISPKAESAARPMEAKALQRWLCANLVAPFDFPKAVKTFPFDTLGNIAEKKETKPGGARSADTTSVEQAAKSDSYTVTWSYQYSEDNVSAPYGFSLSIDVPYQADVDPMQFPHNWLQTVGKPVFSVMGYEVGYGQKFAPNAPWPAGFGYWSTGRIVVHWFSPSDIDLLKPGCRLK